MGAPAFWQRHGRWGALLAAAIGALVLLSLVARIYLAGQRDASVPSDVIVVLGAAQYDGRPSPVLRARIDHAVALYRAGYAPRLFFTGGSRPGDRYTEAEVARAYAIRAGVPAAATLTETKGRTTWQSLSAVKHAMARHGLRRAILVSDPFHAFRLQRMADDLGLPAVVSPDRDSPIRGRGAKAHFIMRELLVYMAYCLLRV